MMCSCKGSFNNAYDTLNSQKQIYFIKGLTIVKALFYEYDVPVKTKMAFLYRRMIVLVRLMYE